MTPDWKFIAKIRNFDSFGGCSNISTPINEGPLPRAKFHVYRDNVSPLRGEKPMFGPRSKNNRGMAALRNKTRRWVSRLNDVEGRVTCTDVLSEVYACVSKCPDELGSMHVVHVICTRPHTLVCHSVYWVIRPNTFVCHSVYWVIRPNTFVCHAVHWVISLFRLVFSPFA